MSWISLEKLNANHRDRFPASRRSFMAILIETRIFKCFRLDGHVAKVDVQHTVFSMRRRSIFSWVTRRLSCGQLPWWVIIYSICVACLMGAVYQLKGDDYATLEWPPSHRLFDTAAAMSPVLLQWKAAQDAKNAATSLPPSRLNISVLKLATLMCQGPPPPPYPYQYPPQPQLPPSLPPGPSLMLLPASQDIGPSLTLEDFCNQFDLPQTICTKLHDEGSTGSHLLQYVAISDLKEMGFKFGEITSLKDAVAHWSMHWA